MLRFSVVLQRRSTGKALRAKIAGKGLLAGVRSLMSSKDYVRAK